MPTLAEVWTATGIDINSEPYKTLLADTKAMSAVNGIFTSAEQKEQAAKDAVAKAEADLAAAKAAQDAAELAQRANKEFYDQTIMPSLTGWEDKEKQYAQEIANAKALAAFYEAQNKAAKESGFIAADAPTYTPTAVVPARDPNGKFIAGVPGGTPGSPTFKMEEVENRIGQGLDNSVWALQEYQRLSGGQFLPDSVSTLAQEASAVKLSFKDYVSKKYDFPAKQAALQAQAKEKERQEWVAQATAPLQEQLKQKDVEWQAKLEAKAKEVSERGGNNPDVRRAAISNYPEVKRAVAEGTRKDPLSMTREERQVEMRRQIQADVAKNEEEKQGVAA